MNTPPDIEDEERQYADERLAAMQNLLKRLMTSGYGETVDNRRTSLHNLVWGMGEHSMRAFSNDGTPNGLNIGNHCSMFCADSVLGLTVLHSLWVEGSDANSTHHGGPATQWLKTLADSTYGPFSTEAGKILDDIGKLASSSSTPRSRRDLLNSIGVENILMDAETFVIFRHQVSSLFASASACKKDRLRKSLRDLDREAHVNWITATSWRISELMRESPETYSFTRRLDGENSEEIQGDTQEEPE